MSTDRNVSLPPDVWSRMSEAARAEGKSVDSLLEEAVLRLLQVRDLRSFVAENRELAEQGGLTEADIPRFVAESRQETASTLRVPVRHDAPIRRKSKGERAKQPPGKLCIKGGLPASRYRTKKGPKKRSERKRIRLKG